MGGGEGVMLSCSCLLACLACLANLLLLLCAWLALWAP